MAGDWMVGGVGLDPNAPAPPHREAWQSGGGKKPRPPETFRQRIERITQTAVTQLAYNFVTHRGQLGLPAHCGTDMRGTLEVFREIDPEVRKVYVFVAGEPDVVYRRADGEPWIARRLIRRR